MIFLQSSDGVTLDLALYHGISEGLARLFSSPPATTIIAEGLRQMDRPQFHRVADLGQHVIKPALVNEGFSLIAAAPLMAKGHLQRGIVFHIGCLTNPAFVL